MKILSLLFLLLLVSCNSESGSSQATLRQQCQEEKDIFSEWETNDGDIYDLSGGSFATLIPVTDANGCQDGDGDFLLYLEHDGGFNIRNCSDAYSHAVGTWRISCDKLILNYSNGDREELF